MINNFRLSVKRASLITGLVIGVIYFWSILMIFINYNSLFFEYIVSIRLVEVLSLLLFLISFYIGNKSLKLYFILLIFNILAMPSSIDNLLPSVMISSNTDNLEEFFPLLTHIDIYLIFGLLRFYRFETRHFIIKLSPTLIISVLLIFTSIIYNIIFYKNAYDTSLILSSSYHLRYLLLFLLLFWNTDILQFKDCILKGILISAIFLIIESIFYTHFFINSSRIISGTLGNNSFGNIMTAVICYLVFLLIRKRISKFYGLFIFLLIITVFLTKTRSAIFILLIYMIFEWILYLKKTYKTRPSYVLYSTFISLLILISLYALSSKNERFNIKNFNIEKIDLKRNSLVDIVGLEENKFTMSLIYRLNHFQTSLNMIKDKPILGIGTGRWNISKSKYGSKDHHLMDSHNDILAMSSQYGVLPGILFCLIIYLSPFWYYIQNRNENHFSNNPVEYLFVINFVMMFVGLTNAGLFKHQLLGLLALIVAYSFTNNRIEKRNII